EAYQPLYRLTAFMVGIVAATGVVIVLVTAFIARSLARPITELTVAAARIASGALDERVSIQTRNELSILAKGFNEMTATLQRMVEAERSSRAYLEHTQAALRESEEKMRLVTNNMRDMILQSDEKGTIQYVSPSAREVWGIAPGDLL